MSNSSKQQYYFQEGGNMPNRFYNPNATAFSNPDNSSVGQQCQCPKCLAEKNGGGCQCPKCLAKKKQQEGGAISMPYRYFNPTAGGAGGSGGGAGSGCQSCSGCQPVVRGGGRGGGGGSGAGDLRDAGYYNDFRREQGYDPTNEYNSSQQQRGGAATGAPFHIFSTGEPIEYNYDVKNVAGGAPVFDQVQKNQFW